MHQLPVLRDLVILVAIAIPVVIVAQRLRVPTVVGFLLTGIHEHGCASPDVPADVEWSAGDRGDYRSVAMLGMGAIDAPSTSVGLVATTADGRIFTTTGGPNAWSQFADVAGFARRLEPGLSFAR